jgi:hypothetical protein
MRAFGSDGISPGLKRDALSTSCPVRMCVPLAVRATEARFISFERSGTCSVSGFVSILLA